ncbi:hypothetical protein AGOR_G00212590 [Albula goreensis]|uniref:Apolipoprotein C-I n=1 Tax=Albula goreensis TaxID=1534307 RepID=A0A8T3CQQ0_9TELE|nr:hypothetical protein AGOR_G00212590 [Albula goreensis]
MFAQKERAFRSGAIKSDSFRSCRTEKQKRFLPLNDRKTDQEAKMKLPIAVAVLFLVLAANTEAQEAEPTIEERFATFGNQMKEFADDLSEKTKTAFEQIHQSDFAVKTRSWFSEQFEKMKDTLEKTFPKQ